MSDTVFHADYPSLDVSCLFLFTIYFQHLFTDRVAEAVHCCFVCFSVHLSIFIIKIKKNCITLFLFNAFVLIDKGEKFAILPDGAHCSLRCPHRPLNYFMLGVLLEFGHE